MGPLTPRRGGWLLALLLIIAPPAWARTLTDATGRSVDAPDRIERVMPAGPPAAVLLYTLAPEKMIGWPHAPSPAAKAFLEGPVASRPELTPLIRDGKVQSEAIRAAKPDLILDYGSTSTRYAERAARIQQETGVPVVLLDGRLERTPEIYRLLGPVLGAEARADELAAAAERLLAITREKAPARHQQGEVRAYYARSADGLTTASAASSLGDVLRLLDVTNVADGAGPGELLHVTREQIAAWQPEVIVTNNPEFWKARTGPGWADLRAVAPRPRLPGARPALRLDRRAAIGQPAARAAVGRPCSLSGGLSRRPQGRGPGFLPPFLSGRAHGSAARRAAALNAEREAHG